MKIVHDTVYRDHLSAFYLHQRPPPIARIGGICLIIMGIFLSIHRWTISTRHQAGDFILPGALLYLFLYFFVFIPFQIRTTLRHNKFRQHKVTLDISNDGIHFSSDLSESSIPWNHFFKWKESTTLILLYFVDNQFAVFPKRLFADESEWQEFRSILKSNVNKPQ